MYPLGPLHAPTLQRSTLRVGVISDTHNYLDPRIPALFAGVEHILHGGDIGRPAIILALEQIAPVTAVSGNTDEPGFHYRQTEVVELGGHKFLVHHIVSPESPGATLRARLERERPEVVVFGHTHKPFSRTIGGILFFNPGYAGKPRFGLARSATILHCGAKAIRVEHLPL